MPSVAVDLCRLEGLVVPSSWDDRGGPLGVALLTDDEGEHFLAGTTAGQALLNCVHKRVCVFGRTETDGRGNRLFVAERFEVLSP
jgi:hypothetical protein